MFILDVDITMFSQLIRGFFATIDSAVYGFIAVVYNLIEDLANTSILSMTDMNEFASRIYALLGIFMLFKVSFSIISYIVSPDKISDSSTGMGGIIKNVLITLVLILIVPTCFTLLYEAQSAILSENIIPKLLLGTNSDANTIDNEIYVAPTCKIIKQDIEDKDPDVLTTSAPDSGNYISLMIFRNFYQLGQGAETADDEDYFKNTFLPYYCGYKDQKITVSYLLQSQLYNGPIEEIEDDSENVWEEIASGVGTVLRVSTAIVSLGISELGIFAAKSIYNYVSSKLGLGPSTYYIDYNYFVSTIVGIFVIFILISMAFDVAIRSVKLTFLQLISPIPIISYVDPKSGKDGMFKRWYTEVFKTWASLFIRLLALFFGVYLIKQLGQLYRIGNHKYLSSNFWIQLFMLLGVLMFCKELPKLLEQLIPGMKGSGSFKLNPLKRINEDSIGGKFLTGGIMGAGAMTASALGGAGANAIHSIRHGKNWKDSFKSAGRGLGTGAFYGAKNGFAAGKSGKYNVMSETGKSIQQSSKHRNYEDMLAAQGEIKGPFKAVRNQAWDKFTDLIGEQQAMGGTGVIKGRIKELQEQLDQEQGRENQYNTAFGNYTAKNPARTPGYVEAGKYKVTKDENGKFVGKMEYSSYQEYMAKITGDGQKIKDMEKEISKNLQGVFRNEAERKLAVDKELGKRLEKDYKNTDKFISQNEFTEVQNLSSAIAESSAIQKDLKSQIGKIENNQLGNDSSK